MSWKDRCVGHNGLLSDVVDGGPTLRILCPLAGDDPFVRYAWSQGHDVTAIDIVPDALKAMRDQFGDNAEEDWTSSEGEPERGRGLVWTHASGRATLFEGDILTKRPALNNRFDVIYDKDSFGALPLNVRPKFCERMSEFHKDGGTLYTEVKNKETGRENGPPFHVEKEDLMAPTAFGAWYEHKASLGEVPGKVGGMKQMGHILKRAMTR